MVKFTALFSLVGLVIPVILTLFWKLLEQYRHAYLAVGRVMEIVQLLIWPSSIFMIATAGSKDIDYGMLALSIITNIAFYAVIGFLIWWGLNKQRWVIYLAMGLIALIWYKLFTL